ncbi:MAG: adenosylcobinamide-phosphate synthase CbiB [Pseudomonadota bacterium]
MIALSLGLALTLDRLLGWPDWVLARIGHPVMWIGALITWAERRLNRAGDSVARQRLAGCLCVAITCLGASLPAVAITLLLPSGPIGWGLTALLAMPFLAAHSMVSHVRAVAEPLCAGDVDTARKAVSMIVGRDPATLDAPAIARAATESLAENTSDGIVAPVFWGLVLGLPGLVLYKAINTLDSMIGYRNDRYLHFGWAAARLDDVANLVPARLTGGLYVLLGARAWEAVRRHFALMWREAARHRSPNAGWPETAMAASLGVRLSGPRHYHGRATQDPWLNGDAPDPQGADLHRALGLFDRLVWVCAGALVLAGLLWI